MRCGSTIRLIADHILERRDRPELELELTNVETLCQACHNAKTAKARARRAGR
ncbi:MAG: HNH endonuclease [Hyphomicrobiaceae bacterium]|nr:HNH endonuclease [Hyphomicrobiaceae bacterium]